MGIKLRDFTSLSSALFVVVIISVASSSLAQDTLGNLQENARNGDPEAQFILGKKYVKGDGVPKNFDQGVKWLTAAANQRQGQAQLNLGILYFYGWGVQASKANAKHWFERAAKNGANEASYYLGKQELRSVTGAPSQAAQQATTTPPAQQAAPQPSYQTPRTQPQLGTPTSGNAYDLRGIQLGMSLAEFRAYPFPDKSPKYPTKVFCTGDQVPNGSSIFHQVFGEDLSMGLITCNYYEFRPYAPGISLPPSWNGALLRVATISTYMTYSFIPDPNFSNTPRLFKIRVRSNVKYWDTFWSAYTGKYGQPDEIDNTPAQNKMGATFDNVVATWRNEESSILLYKRLGKIESTRIFYIHNNLAMHESRMRERITGKPSDNL